MPTKRAAKNITTNDRILYRSVGNIDLPARVLEAPVMDGPPRNRYVRVEVFCEVDQKPTTLRYFGATLNKRIATLTDAEADAILAVIEESRQKFEAASNA